MAMIPLSRTRRTLQAITRAACAFSLVASAATITIAADPHLAAAAVGDLRPIMALPVGHHPLSVVLSDDGTTASVLAYKQTAARSVRIVDLASGNSFELPEQVVGGAQKISLSDNGDTLLVAHHDGPGGKTLTVVDTATGAVQHQFPGLGVHDPLEVALSGDGSSIAILTDRDNRRIELIDVATATTTLVANANGIVRDLVISDTGSFVAFYTSAELFTPGVSAGPVIWERSTGLVSSATQTADGVPPLDAHIGGMSGDGRYLALTAVGPNLPAPTMNAVYRFDRVTGDMAIAARDWFGSPLAASVGDISDDGNRLLLWTRPTQIEGQPSSADSYQFYEYDVELGAIQHVSSDSAGAPLSWSGGFTMDGSGATVLVYSSNPDLGLVLDQATSQIGLFAKDMPGPTAGSITPYVKAVPSQPAIEGWFDGPVTIDWQPVVRSGAPATDPASIVVSADGLNVTTSGPSCAGVGCATGRVSIAIDTQAPRWKAVNYEQNGHTVVAEIYDAGSGIPRPRYDGSLPITMTVDGSPCPVDPDYFGGYTCGIWSAADSDGITRIWTYFPTGPVTNIVASDVVGHLAVPDATLTVPDAPTSVVATPVTAGLTVSFQPPTNDGGASITTYTTSCTAPGSATGTTSTTGSPANVTGLTVGATYTCTVRATNAVGDSASSVASTPITLTARPTAPLDIAVATAGARLVSVTFTPPASTGTSPISNYRATCSSTTGGVTRSANSTASPVGVASLTAGATYTCAVSARNAAGTGPLSSASAPVVVLPTAPEPPTAVTAASPVLRTVSLSFSPGVDGGSPITSYRANCVSSNGGATRSGSGSASPIIVSALTPGATYSCTVTATNAVGRGVPSTPSGSFAIATVPGAPSISSITQPALRQTSVSFDPPASDGGNPVTSYRVTCTNQTNGTTRSATGAASPLAVTGLTRGASYRCRATATNAFGTGMPSALSAPFTVT